MTTRLNSLRSAIWCVLALPAVLAGLPMLAAELPLAGSSSPEAADSATPVDIPDPVLRKKLEEILGKSPGARITRSEMATLQSLYLSGSSDYQVQQLAGIEHAVNIESLQLPGHAISDLDPLADLTALTRLWLYGNAITDVVPLANLTALTWLGLSNNQIADVAPLSDLTALTHLDLNGNEIADVAPLSGLTALTALGLGYNKVADVTPLAGLTALSRSLFLSGNQIADVAPLAGLTALTRLFLGGNQIADVAPLSGLTALTRLELYGNDVDVAPLAGLTALTWLDLAASEIADVAPLSGLTALTWLDLSGNDVADVAPLSGLTALTSLELSGNEIADVAPLSGLTALTSLGLGYNQIADVAPLASLTALTELDLRYNQIADVAPLASLTALTELDLRYNQIADVAPLASLPTLRELSLASNGMVDVSSLSGLTALTELDLRYNQIADVAPLASLPTLRELNLASNGMVDVSSLSGLTALSWLELYNNDIEDVAPLLANDGLNSGDYVGLKGNPLGPISRDTHIPMLLERGVDARFTRIPGLPEMPDIELQKASVRALLAAWADDFTDLRILDASGRGIDDLTGLEGAVSIRRLFLDRNNIADIAPLAELGSLFALSLSRNNTIEDWSPLAGMGSLRVLALDGNSIRELPPLPSGVRYLYLSDNFLSDISSLADIRNLYDLDVSANSIATLAPLAGKSLGFLHVHDNEVADISPLNFGRMRELHMRNNAVRDISPLLNAERLLMADVRRNPLDDDALAVLDTLRERRVTVLAGETDAVLPLRRWMANAKASCASSTGARTDGHVFVEGVDDAGVRAGPVRVEVGALRAVHFNSTDWETGNAAKGIDGVGAPTAGDWRLSVISALDVEVLSYIRTGDGFVAPLHDVAADATAPFFHAAGDGGHPRGILRTVNMEAEPAKWTTGGYADSGRWHPMVGSMLVRPQHALTLTAGALENEHGLGDGDGMWRLRVRGHPWFAMSLLESSAGHLANLSTAPDNATPLGGRYGTLYRLPLFPVRWRFPRRVRAARQPLLRQAAKWRSWPWTTPATRAGPVRLTMRPRRTVDFDSADLESGNADKGLSGLVEHGGRRLALGDHVRTGADDAFLRPHGGRLPHQPARSGARRRGRQPSCGVLQSGRQHAAGEPAAADERRRVAGIGDRHGHRRPRECIGDGGADSAGRRGAHVHADRTGKGQRAPQRQARRRRGHVAAAGALGRADLRDEPAGDAERPSDQRVDGDSGRVARAAPVADRRRRAAPASGIGGRDDGLVGRTALGGRVLGRLACDGARRRRPSGGDARTRQRRHSRNHAGRHRRGGTLDDGALRCARGVPLVARSGERLARRRAGGRGQPVAGQARSLDGAGLLRQSAASRRVDNDDEPAGDAQRPSDQRVDGGGGLNLARLRLRPTNRVSR